MSLRDAILQAMTAARQAASADITYRRGESETELTAIVGRTPFEQVNESGVVTRFESRDYLIIATELVIDDEQTLPAIGDQIREIVGNEVQVYKVLEMGGQPHWRYSDQFRTTLRVHTKHVSTEEAP